MNPIPQNETVEDGHTELVGADALMAIERSQIDTQISTAKKYPRSPTAFLKEASSMISLSVEVAEGCNYKLKRKGKDGVVIIEGPSVRLLEIAASSYGNLKYGSRTIAIDEEFVTAQGVAFDLEKNVSSSVEVKRSIKGKFGRYSQDMIMVTANAAGAIARRNALNGIIPRVYISLLSEQAKKVALGDIKTLPERRQKALDYFTKSLGVDLKLVLAYLERASIDDCTLEDVGELQALKTALKEGTTTVEEIFSPINAAGTTGQKPPLDPPAQKERPLPPLPNQGPSNKGEAKPKPAPAPAAATPQPEPPKEEPPKAQPKEEPKTEPTKDPEPQQQPPQEPQGKAEPAEAVAPSNDAHAKIQAELDERGVAFDDFRDWLLGSGRFREAPSMKSLADLPADKAAEILVESGKGRPLDRCLKIHGTK